MRNLGEGPKLGTKPGPQSSCAVPPVGPGWLAEALPRQLEWHLATPPEHCLQGRGEGARMSKPWGVGANDSGVALETRGREPRAWPGCRHLPRTPGHRAALRHVPGPTGGPNIQLPSWAGRCQAPSRQLTSQTDHPQALPVQKCVPDFKMGLQEHTLYRSSLPTGDSERFLLHGLPLGLNSTENLPSIPSTVSDRRHHLN